MIGLILVSLGVGQLSFAATASCACDPNIFVALSKKVVPSVVNISTSSVVRGEVYSHGNSEDLFRKFFEDYLRGQGGAGPGDGDDEGEDPGAGHGPRNPRAPRAMSLGTGFIIGSDGLILTNNHVVADADEIKVYFTEDADEKSTDGEVVGRDPDLDLALIKVKTDRKLMPLTFGDSDALDVGEYVVAIGNPFGQGHSVTHGIISAKGRPAPDFALASYLQTDTPINPGNSGGPLINLKGEVIGINNAIDQRAQGIGFAIPSNLVKTVLPQLRTSGSVSRGYIGVLVNDLTPELASKLSVSKTLHAPFVSHVYPGEPAEVAGLKPYDVVLEFNSKPVKSGNDLMVAVTAARFNEAVPVKILRAGFEKILSVKVGKRPNATPPEAEPTRKKHRKKHTHIDTGMEIESLTPEVARDLGLESNASGVVVDDTVYGGPAEAAGLARGDVIVEVDRKTVKDDERFFAIVHEKKSYLLRVRRSDPQGRESFMVVILDLSRH